MSGSVADEALRLIAFWRAAGRSAWFSVDSTFDEQLHAEFGALHEQAMTGTLDGWIETADGALALVLLLDQLSRNLHRGSSRAFDGDARALSVAEAAVERGFDQLIDTELRPFVYLPFEHAEHMAAQERSVALTASFADETKNSEPLRWARHHRDIVARFGRFPHRNATLGRISTGEELEFLSSGGFNG